MLENYSKLDYFENEKIYTDLVAQKIYEDILEKSREYFSMNENTGYQKDIVSDLYKKLREFYKSETLGYSIFSGIEQKVKIFEAIISFKISNYTNNSISKQNEYKKYLLDALKLMYNISLFKKSGYNLKQVFTSVNQKYYFLAFLDSIYLQEIYEGLINEVDYCIGKLSELGLIVDIDFENGFISTNGLKYSFLKETSISIDFQYKNPYPRIFKNKSCYDLFLWLKDNFVVDEYADYSHIYYEMLKRSLIYKIPHNEYIQFLFDELNIELNYDRLKSSAKIPINKNNTFKNGIDIIKPFSTVV
jgi:hypothetical protein